MIMTNNTCTFEDWTSFYEVLEGVDWSQIDHANVHDLMKPLGVHTTLYDRLRNMAVQGWKDSCSKSLFDFLIYEQVTFGAPVFHDLLTQTRFLTFLRMERVLSPVCVERVFEGNKPVTILGSPALTISDHGRSKFNHILQTLYLYKRVCRAIWRRGIADGSIRPPKYLYRGQVHLWYGRSGIFKHFKPSNNGSIPYHQHVREQMDYGIKYVMDHGVSCLTDRTWMATTSKMTVAKYFTNKESFILRIPFSAVLDVLTSEVQEPILDEPDYVSGKHEHEYIVRVDPNWRPKMEDFTIYSRHYLTSKADPMCVECLDHDNIIVRYRMDGRWIQAQYRWKTNETGGVCFKMEEPEEGKQPWMMGRRSFKKEHGFDPMPTEKNRDQIDCVLVADTPGRWTGDEFKLDRVFARSGSDDFR